MKSAAFPRLFLPWAIQPEALQRIIALDPAKCEHHPDLASVSEEDYEERLEVENGSGIAVLSVRGPLVVRPALWERYFYGAADLERLEILIRNAEADSTIRGLILAIDSPGGTVTGTPEVGAAVAEFAKSKPIVAFSNSLMASAAYWIGSAVGEGNLYVTPSARVGSVGVIAAHVDLSEYYKREGVKIRVFTSGKFKGAGAYGTALTDEQDAHLQAEVDALGEQFRATVRKHRGADVNPDALQGQVLYGRDALPAGLVDSLVANSAAAFVAIRQRVTGASRTLVDMGAMGMKLDPSNGDTAGAKEGAETATHASADAGANGAPAESGASAQENGNEPGAHNPEIEAAEAQAAANGGAVEHDGEGGSPEGAGAAEGAEAPQSPEGSMAAMIRDLAAENATLKAENASLRERVVSLESAAKTLDGRAAEIAASVAAQAGAEPVNVTPAGEHGAANSEKSILELYQELQAITGKDEQETQELQRAFYLQHIKPRQNG